MNWSPADLAWLTARLAQANGRRTARRLELAPTCALLDRFLATDDPFTFFHGGDVDDARQTTTVCLAVKVPGALTIGVSTSRTGPAAADRAFADLKGWDRWTPSANVTKCERWAMQRRDDRRQVVLPAAPVSLLDAIHAAPDDDRPRLVYADRLMEQGDPRGEFIALQCSAATTGDPEATRRSRELLTKHSSTWFKALHEHAGLEVRRGFLEGLTVIDPAVVDGASDVLEHEAVRHLVLSVRGRLDLERVLRWPWIDKVRALAIQRPAVGQPMSRDALETLASTLRLRRLESLSLSGQGLGDAGLRTLAVSDAFPTLRAFSVVADDLTTEGLDALCGARWQKKLERLELLRVELDDAGVERLCRARWPKLTRLSLASNRIGDAGAFTLSKSTFPKLEVLTLTSNRIGPRGATALLGRRGTLKLALEANPIGAANERALAASG